MRTPALLALALAPAVALGQPPAPAPAQEAPGGPPAVVGVPAAATQGRPVTLEEVLAAARRYNRDIRAAREHLNQAAADVDRAWAALLPIVSAQGKYTHNNIEAKLDPAVFASFAKPFGDALQDLYTKTKVVPDPAVLKELLGLQSQTAQPIVIQKGEQLDAVASAQVPLLVPWAWYQLRAARQSLLSQQQSLTATESGLLLQVAGAFYGAAGSDEMVQARQHGIEVAQKTLHDAEVRFQAGVVNRVEVSRAKVALLRAEQALRESIDTRGTSYRALRTLSGIEPPFYVLAPEEPPAVETDPRALVDDALRLRPELHALARQVDAAQAGVTSSRLRWLPNLSAFGLFRAFNYKGFYPDYYAWAAGVQLDWLLYDGGLRQAAARQYASAVRETQLRDAQLRDQIADDVVNLRANLVTKRRGLATAREEQQLAADTLELVRVQREAGTATQLDLLTAQDQLILTELNVARLRFDLGLTNLQLQRAIGRF